VTRILQIKEGEECNVEHVRDGEAVEVGKDSCKDACTWGVEGVGKAGNDGDGGCKEETVNSDIAHLEVGKVAEG
jgi:hypothetical protein